MTHLTARPASISRHIAVMAGRALALAAASLVLSVAQAAKPAPRQVLVADAWVRATVPGQSGTGGFMTLTAREAGLSLSGFSSSVAETAELHEMALDGDVMRMRPVDGLPLPLGQKVALKPGGHHLMLIGLKQPLKAGSTVPLVLRFQAPNGKLLEQKVVVPVRAAAPSSPGATSHDDHHEHHDHAH